MLQPTSSSVSSLSTSNSVSLFNNTDPSSSSTTSSSPPNPSSTSPTEGWYSRPLRETTRPSYLPPSPNNDLPGNNLPRRRPIPLHQSSLNISPQNSPRSPRFSPSLTSYHEGPRSPREKLDALLAEENVHSSAAPTPTQSNPNPPLVATTALRGAVSLGKPSSHAQLRNVSAPVPRTTSVGNSPPSSPAMMPPPSRPHRPAEARPTNQRTHSIDSQVSTLSSNSQSYKPSGHAYKPSQDGTSQQPPDIPALIASAGSPEAAILALWKEKQSASNHNNQLWRLVEKQRAMIIGLNKDLERSLKDKDRYRTKLKEYASQVPPVPGLPQRSDTFDSVVEREESASPAPSERLEEHAKPNKSSEQKVTPSPQESTTITAKTVPDSQLAESPSHSSETQSASGPSSSINSPTDYSVKPLNVTGKGLGLNSLMGESISIVTSSVDTNEAPREKAVTGSPSSASQLQAPSLSITQATPIIGRNGFETPTSPEKPAHPSRKPPPAPLKLAKPAQTSAHLYQSRSGNQDESDYDDTLEVDEIPTVERGRRKTREEDDRVREAMMVQDDEARSKSKKKKSESKSKSGATSDDGLGSKNASVAGSLSPRMLSPAQVGLPMSPRHPPAGSLNALLSPTNSDSSMMANRSVGSPPLMSPGLPMSPRPGDRPMNSPLPRNPKQSLASPPVSPRSGLHGMPQPAPRPPRQPIPLPPNTPQSYTSPNVARADVVARSEPAAAQLKPQSSSSDFLRLPNAQSSPDADNSMTGQDESEHVYRGLVSEQYPGLLLPPNALPSIDVKVFSSRLRPSRLSFMAPKPQEEDPVFILAIYARSNSKQLWRVEKTIMALPALDTQLKSQCDFQGKLPDRALFSGHAPAKIDARRAALNLYFDTLLETPMNEKAAMIVCEFFSTDVIGAQNDAALSPEHAAMTITPTAPGTRGKQRKEGYLTKRGKNFGGWKARYFILEGPEFRYYEMVGGAHLGTIKLQNAQIGKQSQQQSNQSPQRRDDSEDNQYRHAFLILEPKRKDSSSLVRHVLCAESDEERDAWVDALLQHVDWQDDSSPIDAPAKHAPSSKAQTQEVPSRARNSPDSDQRTRLQGLSYDDTIAAEAPVRGPAQREPREGQPHSPKLNNFSDHPGNHHPSISGPTNGAPIQNAEFWGNKSLAAPTTVKDKKRSIFGFRGRASSDLAPAQAAAAQQLHPQERVIQHNRNVFGIPLQEAVEYSQPAGLRVPLPAVVYRCLEYLKAKKASQEEGIFRLSGSNIVIRGLRERFNSEGDVNLLGGEYYDVHAVASLLKLYLRELPSSILTRELHLDFLKVLDMDERSKKIQAFNVLVHRLPTVNFELLRAMSSFLIEIIDNAGQNKMTVRNVGIVFAPTLNIPAPLISMFLTDFPDIFGTEVDEATSPIHEIVVSTPPLPDDAIRSPRRQMFSDLPTPAYNTTSFGQAMDAPASFPQQLPQLPQPRQQQQQQQQQQYAGYETGFIPLRPSYDAPMYEQQFQGAEGYGSLNGALQPGNSREAKQRKRESGMLLMNMGMSMGGAPRNASGSNQRARDESRMVREGTAFD
ncbi:hypothetical protein BU24DRAFT_346195 [Aaosphaeria arxii CBS 175.79]|uniref:RhoGAP-domain-containing protein n=1 Tax=Aaosphaeria arxii CBS 175.79 TaxID=1450172 RepID=A0A6A5XTC6_9PLEO|nr:uncharacterized protein BU24DRAFT_346195 [Aaosphaeria arxii CBS 175.79]KAF2015971.1 hypothetical protein BU24DRAFT_346195 [Aaosphaeria arxii CBS 175.79]